MQHYIIRTVCTENGAVSVSGLTVTTDADNILCVSYVVYRRSD